MYNIKENVLRKAEGLSRVLLHEEFAQYDVKTFRCDI